MKMNGYKVFSKLMLLSFISKTFFLHRALVIKSQLRFGEPNQEINIAIIEMVLFGLGCALLGSVESK